MRCEPKQSKWQRYAEMIEDDLREWGIEQDPPRLPEYLGKAFTDESIGHKGICFVGGVGSGKTRRQRFITEVEHIGHFLSAREITDYAQNWIDDELSMAKYLYCDVNSYDSVPFRYFDIVIDDLGTEPQEIVVYGNKYDPMQIAIEMRYKAFQESKHWKTYITTNLNQEQLLKRYGERAFSRLNEMCAFIPITHPDRRMPNI